jgi:hypothetical protein
MDHPLQMKLIRQVWLNSGKGQRQHHRSKILCPLAPEINDFE